MSKVSEVIKEIRGMNIPWTESPFFGDLLAASGADAASAKLARDFAEKGYVIIDLGIPDFDRVADRVVRNLESRYPKGERRLAEAWYFDPDVRAIATADAVLKTLGFLYGREAIPFQTLNFREGTEQDTHSDAIHFYSAPARFMCGVWVALEDVDENNGPLHYYPGSHKFRDFTMNDLGLSSKYENYGMYEDFLGLLLETQRLERHELKMSRGQALVWAAGLYHGGSPIRQKGRTRHSQVTHYFFPNCLYYMPLESDPFINQITVREVIDIRTGRFVPHVYDGKRRKLADFAKVWKYPRPLPAFVDASDAG